jgi:ABC-type nitrate/sulfonate/bicarbonate transport system substrate-binding protein
MAALVSGELDVYDVASGSLVPAALSGADLVLIASDSNRTIFGLIATPDLAVPTDLRGKALGVTQRGSSDDFVTQRYLRARGLEPNTDVVLQPVGGIPEKLVAMEVGHIAGGVVSPPTLFVALERGMKLLDRPADLFEYQGSGLVLQRARLQGADGESLGRALVGAHVEAIQAIRADRALALRALDRYAPSPSTAIAEQTLDWTLAGLPPDGVPTLEGLRAVVEDVLSARGTAAALEPADLVDLRFLREQAASRP